MPNTLKLSNVPTLVVCFTFNLTCDVSGPSGNGKGLRLERVGTEGVIPIRRHTSDGVLQLCIRKGTHASRGRKEV